MSALMKTPMWARRGMGCMARCIIHVVSARDFCLELNCLPSFNPIAGPRLPDACRCWPHLGKCIAEAEGARREAIG